MMNQSKTVTLCVVFNHAYPKNIPLLRDLYKDRFSEVRFIQPMQRSEDSDVYTTGRGSYNFHGSIADFSLSYKPSTDYVVFIQDDVLLNPRINERNLSTWFKLDEFDAYLPAMHPIDGNVSGWMWIYQTLWKTLFPMNPVSGSGVEAWLQYLPKAEEVEEKLKRLYGFEYSGLRLDLNGIGTTWEPYVMKAFKDQVPNTMYGGLSSRFDGDQSVKLPFPLCRGMSDFFVVRKDVFKTFVDALVVFSALQVFAEIAIPTALAIASSRIANDQNLNVQVNWLWESSRESLNTDAIAEGFKDNLLLIHPVKMSLDYPVVKEILSKVSQES